MPDEKIVETPVADLEIGMYVAELDRPWSSSGFLVQGFYIQSPEDLEALRAQCEYVFIDVFRTRKGIERRNDRHFATHPSVARSEPLRPGQQPRESASPFRQRAADVPAQLFPHRKLKKYEDACGVEEELPRAKRAYADLGAALAAMMEEFQRAGTLDISGVTACAGPVVDSVVRNPDACVWLARLRNEDTYTFRHAAGACVWAVALGRELGLPRLDLQRLALGALLFDVGKLRVPRELLLKRGRLTRGEFELLKSHVAFGMELLQNTGALHRNVAEMVQHHHERHGGHGYPAGLKGEAIPVMGRIAAIVDCYDAITSQRPYAVPISPSNAVKKLYAWRDIDFHADLVEEFIQVIGIYPAGTLVELTGGEVGVVLAGYRTRRLRPKVLLLLDREKRPIANSRVVDLDKGEQGGDGRLLEIATSLEPGAFGLVPESLSI
ncbi:MAG: HD-GYP domain-containing protein [Gammaproteobacteria bacterium]